MSEDKFIKFGGIKFTNNVPPSEINKYVQSLSDNDRLSLFKVVKKLDHEGLISLDDSELSTIDDETIDWQK